MDSGNGSQIVTNNTGGIITQTSGYGNQIHIGSKAKIGGCVSGGDFYNCGVSHGNRVNISSGSIVGNVAGGDLHTGGGFGSGLFSFFRSISRGDSEAQNKVKFKVKCTTPGASFRIDQQNFVVIQAANGDLEFEITGTGEVALSVLDGDISLPGGDASWLGPTRINCDKGDVIGPIKTVSGDVHVGGNVTGSIDSTSGEVQVHGNANDRVSTISGSVSIGGHVAGPVKTVSGDVNVRNRD